MEVPPTADVGQDMWPSVYPARVAALHSHRRRQRLRTWGTRVSVLIGCAWLVLVVVGGLAH